MDPQHNPSPTVQIVTVLVTGAITILTTISSVIIAHLQLKAKLRTNTAITEEVKAYSVEAKAQAVVAAIAAKDLGRKIGGKVFDLESQLEETRRQLSGLLALDSKEKKDGGPTPATNAEKQTPEKGP